ncbi:MAG: glycosyltransferase [Acidimicrobiales bacterium]
MSPYSLSVPGGVQGQVLGLARALRARGHQVAVLGPADGPPAEDGIITLGQCLPAAVNGSVAPIAPDPTCVRRTLSVLADEPFDVLHLHEPLSPGPTLTSLILGAHPIVGTFHAASGGTGAYRFLRPLARWLAQRLTVRVAVSDQARTMARRNIGGSYQILPNGIDLARAAAAVPWPTSGPTIFFCSRHEARKGLSVLLGAMGHLGSDVRLWVASEGPQTPTLRRSFGHDPRIEWLGRIGDEEKLRRMRAARVMCAPSLHGESFGMILLEAMAAQTPVVASDIDGYRQVLSAEGGVLVPPGDPVALGRALADLLDDAARGERLGIQGQRRARDFSMDSLAGHYESLYLAAADQHRPPRTRGRELQAVHPSASLVPAVPDQAILDPAVPGPAVSGPAVSDPAVSDPAVSDPQTSSPAGAGRDD